MDDEVRALLDRQKRMAEAAERLQTAPDVETLLQWVSQLEGEAKELEKRAVAWGKKMEAAYPPKKGMHGYIEVVLTPDQRAKIKQETGIVMESVRIDDPSGALNYAMMSASPPDITPIAMEQARSNAFREKAKQEAKRSIDTQLTALENQSPEMAENVQKLKTDPRFQELMRFGDK
jgi:hypothetical protein